MTVREMKESMHLKLLGKETGMDEEVKGGYIGDLLSFVMAHAQSKDAWITVQGHMNSIAVAIMTGVSAIILAQGVVPNLETIEKANEEKISIFTSEKSSFELAYELGKLLE
ncbi:hypothetical protein [Cellulosilyticum ruminicola]|uniref:hypothetical protein n=1 Tax=Cellulosilyticum ruminicola TaxID=425254 RepID=UPI0006CF8F97|nr:hypothetical protein [Cellulosilyticum ruminicola]